MKFAPTLSLVALSLASIAIDARAGAVPDLQADQLQQLGARRLANAAQAHARLEKLPVEADSEGPASADDRRGGQRHRVGRYRVECLDCNLPGVTLRPVKINSSRVVAANDIATGQGYVVASGLLIPTPLVAGATISTVRDINDAGHLVGIQATATADIAGYLWRPGTITLIANLEGTVARPSGINAADQVSGSNSHHAFLYAGGVTSVLPLPPGHAIAWSTGLNVAGHVVGSSYSGGVYFDPDGWRYANGAITVLSQQFVSTYANAVNDLDEVAGTVDSYAAYWTASGRLKILNTLPNFSTGMANAINIHGTVVGILAGNNSAAYPRIAFLWDGRTMINLNTLIQGGPAAGWQLTEADSINDSGVIVGVGQWQGQAHAFMATPVNH